MKKQINGKLANIDVDFFSDYLYGIALQKVTLSSVQNNYKELSSKFITVIKKYQDIYNKLDDIMKYVENVPKYCIIGELLKIPYVVSRTEKCLIINLGKFSIKFKGDNWSVNNYKELLNVITWDDLYKSNKKKYQIYALYLKEFPDTEKWFSQCFPTLWTAIDNDLNKLKAELPTICSFINVNKLDLKDNIFIDPILKIKYNLILSVSSKQNEPKTPVMVLDLSSPNTIVQQKTVNKSNNFSVYKQYYIENQNSEGYGKEQLENTSEYIDIFNTLNKNNCNVTKGIILDDTTYYECNNDIFKSKNGISEKLIQNGKLFGLYDNKYILISYKENKGNNIYKNTIYMLKDNFLDIVDIKMEIVK